MKYFCKNVVLSALLFVATQAVAESDHSGFFFGVAAGSSFFTDDDEFDDSGLTLDDADSSIKLLAGYQILRYLAVEVAYTDFGEFEFTQPSTSGRGAVEATAFSVAAVGILPVASSGVEFYAKGGLSIINLDTADSSSININRDDSGGGFILGVGVSYTPIDQLSLFAGIDTHNYVLTIDRGFFEDDYAQTLGSVHVGASLNF